MKKISKEEQDKLSFNKIKRKIAKLFVEESGVMSEPAGDLPDAIIMAGIPGSGKTEFLNRLFIDIADIRKHALRIDLDEIVKVFEEYTPKTDYRFRAQGNLIVANILDIAMRARIPFVLDGTFGGSRALDNIRRSLEKGYNVIVFVMIEDPERARRYTVEREKKTDRGINQAGFEKSIASVKDNLQKLEKTHRSNDKISIVFVEKDFESDGYRYTKSNFDIERIYTARSKDVL